MSVFWLILAQDQLQDVLAQAGCSESEQQTIRSDLSAALQDTFEDTQAIIVLERINGYSHGLKNHVLRVEYIDPTGESHAAIVKFAEASKLQRELHGWTACGRPANSRGVVLRPLRLGISGANGEPRTIVYEDARQRYRATRLINLESAILTSCRWNDPECRSLEHVLEAVFVELRTHLYQRASPQGNAQILASKLSGRLKDGIAAWQLPNSLQEDCRQSVMTVLPGSVLELLDPLDYLPNLMSSLKLPEVMQGCAHGDLHARNALVGIDGDNALFAAVFDYEDMDTDLLVAWDFVKLETELKVRVYERLFPGEEADFIQQVYEFEQRLSAETIKCSKDEAWSFQASYETPVDRLFALLMTIRRLAKNCLAFESQRSHSWLHEYFFFLAAYGLYAGKFAKTYGRRQFLSAFISAASASEQHAWAKNASEALKERAAARAKLAIQQGQPGERPDIDSAESFHVPFAFAKEFTRSNDAAFISAGIEILSTLSEKFPYVLEIWQELALAFLELLGITGDRDYLHQAKAVLYRLDTRYPYKAHYETLCRHGRLYKDCGDFHFDLGETEMAFRSYEQAIEAYFAAYKIAHNYYPGINAATMYLLTGQSSKSEILATEILERLKKPDTASADDTTWVLATRAEAHLLLGNCDDALVFYEHALERPDCKPHHRSAMQKQLKRILRVKPCNEPNFDTTKLENLFV